MTTHTLPAQRIAALRTAMKAHNIDVYIIPTSDPHNNEYVADRWKGRECRYPHRSSRQSSPMD